MSDSRAASGAAFPVTRWSVVLRAGTAGDEPARRTALAELCGLYWYPLYAFARRDDWTPEDAEDLTQAFFVRVLEEEIFTRTRPERGRLRTFLLTAFRHDLADARRTARRQKRGGEQVLLSIDRDEAEGRFLAEGALQVAPENGFDRHWALSVLAASVARLGEEYAAAGRAGQFAGLRVFLGFGDDGTADYDELAAHLAVTPAAARQSVHRLRERFRRVLRTHVADTLAEATDASVDAELDALRHALAA